MGFGDAFRVQGRFAAGLAADSEISDQRFLRCTCISRARPVAIGIFVLPEYQPRKKVDVNNPKEERQAYGYHFKVLGQVLDGGPMTQANRRTVLPIGMAGLLTASPLIDAEVIRDGSMGSAGPLPGPFYDIQQAYGKTVGTNLFHSFSRFDLNRFEAAVFSGESSIENIFARVTGGSRSTIDGLLGSSITSANLWFINPAGVLFGPHASINVDGSFYVSTANYLRFSDGVRLDTQRIDPGVLTTAAPEAFGFLGEDPAPISFNGSGSQLAENSLGLSMSVPEGKTFAVVGGNISLSDGQFLDSATTESRIKAPGGRVAVVSVASAGEVNPDSEFLDTSGFAREGAISLTSRVTPQGALIDASGERGGAIVVRGNTLQLDNAYLVSTTSGSSPGQAIDIKIRDTAIFSNNGAGIYAQTSGSGRGPNVALYAGRLELTNGAAIQTAKRDRSISDAGHIRIQSGSVALSNASRIESLTGNESSGRGGSISIDTDSLDVSGSSIIGAINGLGGTAAGGSISIRANQIKLYDGSPLVSGPGGLLRGGPSGIFSNAADGDAGALTITADDISLSNGGTIGTDTFGNGNGGDMDISARRINLASSANDPGGLTVISSKASSIIKTPSGRPGSIRIKADTLSLKGPLTGITLPSVSTGDAGALEISSNSLELTDRALILGITLTTGRAADFLLKVADLKLSNGALISNSTLGSGAAGKISLLSKTVWLHESSSMTSETAGFGTGGQIDVTTDDLLVDRNSQISASTGGESAAGNVTINASRSVTVRDTTEGNTASLIRSSTNAPGAAGSVSISTPILNIDGGATVETSTTGDGAAGTVNIETDHVVLTNGGQIGSSSGVIGPEGQLSAGRGAAGTVRVTTKRLEAAGQMTADIRSGVFTQTIGGQGATIDITADEINLSNRALIAADTAGDSKAGTVAIRSRALSLESGAEITSRSGIEAGGRVYRGRGDAGDIQLNVDQDLSLTGRNTQVSTSTLGTGSAGTVTINARSVALRDEAQIGSSSAQDATGKAGDVVLHAAKVGVRRGASILAENYDGEGGKVEINTRRLELRSGGSLSTTSRGTGRAGDISIRGRNERAAAETVEVQGRAEGKASAIRLNAEAGGNGGNLDLRAGQATVAKGGLVSAEAGAAATVRGGSIGIRAGRLAVIDGGRIRAGTLGRAVGGDVRIRSGSVSLGRNAEISSTSLDTGNAGEIDIDAGQRLLSRGASITTEADQANGGNITVNAREQVRLIDSAITTSVRGGKGPGGNIRIDPIFVILQNSRILANADEGPGGNIDIIADQFIPDSDSRVDASSRAGINGRIVISSPDTSMIGKIAALAARYLDPASLFMERCAARYAAGQSSLAVYGLGDVAPAPGEHFYKEMNDGPVNGRSQVCNEFPDTD